MSLFPFISLASEAMAVETAVAIVATTLAFQALYPNLTQAIVKCVLTKAHLLGMVRKRVAIPVVASVDFQDDVVRYWPFYK